MLELIDDDSDDGELRLTSVDDWVLPLGLLHPVRTVNNTRDGCRMYLRLIVFCMFLL